MSETAGFMPADETAARNMSADEAIRYHYDNDTAFFALWLDPTLSYSAGRWRPPLAGGPVPATLAAAQENKIAFHLDAAGVPRGGALLDVGCGWGAVLGAARARGVARAVGLTLSNDQLAHVAARAPAGTEARLEDVFSFEPDAPFDGAVSIGAFEHFATPEMDRPRKIAVYRDFFERMHAALAPGGRLSLQTIVWDALTFEEAKRWIPETVFPRSDIPFVEEVVAASHGPFRLTYMENGADDYARTLAAWIANLQAARETILSRWGEEKYAFFERYLRNSRLAFTRRKNALARFVLQRR
jgi:cyclopropane-fatty-acyl-phospholipid synthase